MLTLIAAQNMPYQNVTNYFDSFTNKSLPNINNLLVFNIYIPPYSYPRKLLIEKLNCRDNFFLIDDTNPNYILGSGCICHSPLRNYHSYKCNSGHISYTIRENERSKGYGTTLLKLLLELCYEYNLSEVCISTLANNIASKKIIEKNHGVFDSVFYTETNRQKAFKYWIKLPIKVKEKELKIN